MKTLKNWLKDDIDWLNSGTTTTGTINAYTMPNSTITTTSTNYLSYQQATYQDLLRQTVKNNQTRQKKYIPKTKAQTFADRIQASIKAVFPDGLHQVPADELSPALRAKFPNGIPAIAGAAAEAEVQVTEEYRPEETPPPVPARKKIVLTREVGTVRDKDGVRKPIHKGSVELVRQMTGPAHETECIGIKVEHRDNSGHVEIPLEALEEAIQRLKENADTSKKKGRFFGRS